MYCPICKDLLKSNYTNSNAVLKYTSPGCGSDFLVSGTGTLVSEEKNTFLHTSQGGIVIASYPCNSKAILTCPGCQHESVVAYVLIDNKKTYGCMCNHTWTQ